MPRILHNISYLFHSFCARCYALITRYKYICLIVLALIIARYMYMAFLAATQGEFASLDMQWYPTKQLFGLGEFTHALNPYIAYLNGDRFLANGPNYMPLMYYVMFPFALLSWEGAKIAFALCNCALFLATLFMLKKAHISTIYLCIITLFAVCGYCFSNVIGNAQSAILIGFFIALAYSFRHHSWILALALSFVCIKHSFGLPLLLGFFLAGYYRGVLSALVIVFITICLFSLQTHATPLETLHLLSLVNSSHYASATSLGGPSDLFSLSQKLFHAPLSPISLLILVIYGSFIWIVYAYKPQTSVIIAASIILSLFSLPHLGYDSYMLCLALLIASKAHKPYSLPLLALLALTLFIFRGERLKPFIDAASEAIMRIYYALTGGGGGRNAY